MSVRAQVSFTDYRIEEAEKDAEQCEEEQALLRRIAEGDSSTIWKLWEKHKKYLYAICLRQMSSSQADAEDALSRAMIKAWDRLPIHAGKINHLKAWLAQLTNNLCLDIHRENRRHLQSFDDLEELLASDYEALAHSLQSPEEVMIRREEWAYLYHLIGQLSRNLREPFVLHFFHGVSYAEIAERLDLSNENVRKRIQQARAILRNRLSKYLSGTESIEELAEDGRIDDALMMELSTAAHAMSMKAEEINSQFVTVRLIKVVLPANLEMSQQILVHHKPQQNVHIETLTKYVNNYPRGWKKRWELARLLYETGHWEEAINEHLLLLDRQPRLIEAYLQLGNMLHVLRRDAEAIAAYLRAIAAARNQSTRHHISGWLEVCRQNYAAAVREFHQASLVEPSNSRHLLGLGLSYLQSGSHIKALQAFNEALTVNPDDAAALTYSYEPLKAVGRMKEAEKRLKRALELDPENALAIKRLADYRSQVGNVGGEGDKKTRWLIRRTLRLFPELIESQEAEARYHLFRGEWEKGLSILRAFVEEHPNYLAGRLSYAHGLFCTGETKAAIAAILPTEELSPRSCEMLLASCSILAEAGVHDRLRHLIEEMLERFPERWIVWSTAGHILARHFKDFNRACVVSAQAVHLQPQLGAAWFWYGRTLALAGRVGEAIHALTEGWKWLPSEANGNLIVKAALWQGECYRLRGEEARALVCFGKAAQQAIALTEQSPAIGYYRRGQALEALGDTVGAMQSYRDSLAKHLLYPKRQRAQEHLARLQSRISSRPEATTDTGIKY